MWRSIRWLDRCIEGHKRKSEQNLFPIVQGGLDVKLREISAKGFYFLLTTVLEWNDFMPLNFVILRLMAI